MTGAERELGIAFVRECFEIDADGGLIWAARPRSHFNDQRSHTRFLRMYAGKPPGRIVKGYVVVIVWRDREPFLLHGHRIVWMLHAGKWPEQHIDHINRIRHDNRIENLRDVAPEVNSKNNGKTVGTGLTGAFPHRSRFRAALQTGGKQRHLGTFDTPQEAHEAYMKAKAQEASA